MQHCFAVQYACMSAAPWSCQHLKQGEDASKQADMSARGNCSTVTPCFMAANCWLLIIDVAVQLQLPLLPLLPLLPPLLPAPLLPLLLLSRTS